MKRPGTQMTRACERGFTLLEMVCVIALVAMVAAVLLPLVPRNTSRARLQGYAIEAASLLKADRNVAIRRGTEVSTLIDASSRAIRSGATAQLIRIPEDVRFEALLPQSCRRRAALSTISFFADGMSCGGAIALTRLDSSYEIRVNWLTGRVEIISHESRAN
jgi:general secretion pathway protein H